MKFDHDNISPLDSRYANKISELIENYSDSSKIKTRQIKKIEWILYNCEKFTKTVEPVSK